MGIRVTGISTPVGGLSWEYTRSDKQNIPLIISPGQKIKVFISSICGVEKYDKVRAELKSAIEATQLADAYTFESKGACPGLYENMQSVLEKVMKHRVKMVFFSGMVHVRLQLLELFC